MSQTSTLHTETVQKVLELIEKKLPNAEAELVKKFARHYYSGLSWDDLKDRRTVDLYGAVLSHWRMVTQNEEGDAAVQVFNPKLEEQGWETSHTVVSIVADNKPFLVDSIRVALNRHNLTAHYIVHLSLNIVKNKEGDITDVLPHSDKKKGAFNIAPLYFEINRITDTKVLSELKSDLACVIDDVSVAVADWKEMLAKADETLEQLEADVKKKHADELNEIKDFMGWLIHDNFTFLGYQDYELAKTKSGLKYRLIPESGLGLLREDRTKRTSQGKDLLAEQDTEYAFDDHLILTKSNVRSTVHRPAYMDYVAIKRFDAKGNMVGERRFMGLYTSTAYNASPRNIPILRQKVNAVVELSGLPASGHSGKELINILVTYPRDELFQATVDELYRVCMGVLQLQERKKVRLFLRKDVFGRFYSCLVFAPRDRYDTLLRQKFQNILMDALQGLEVEFSTALSESILARTLYTVHVDPNGNTEVDEEDLEERLLEATRTWEDGLCDALIDTFGEEQGNMLNTRYSMAFPGFYKETYDPRTAVYDVKRMEHLKSDNDIGMSFYRPLELPQGQFRFKLFRKGNAIPLSDVLPMLENMGLRVLGEHPFYIDVQKEQSVWIQDFTMSHESGHAFEPEEVKDIFQDAFANLWFGRAEVDGFNRLVLAAGLTWRETAVLRAYAKYLRQAGFTFSQAYIEETLARNPHIARMLIDFFKATFTPDPRERKGLEPDTIQSDFYKALDSVANLDEDRILRRFLDVMRATLRTNFFQADNNGYLKPYFSFKFNPERIPDLPLPRPMFEIFVYSPRVEGVHLRFGKVARGGLRWSDRREDFRTEILGLVKAQQVKNSVIVPVGAKGGFVAKQLPVNATRDEVMQEVVDCYSTFIRGLLDISDDLKQGKVVPPQNVIRLDQDDPYLVVAADKGTATFSDIANSISEEYGFWLGDAFASGGSIGYDHKKMGITARGAWESVKRHFREMGINTQEESFTVVGIGDMAGDVFGNGMLLSEHIRLVGAFNHMHIFIDPEPDTAKSFAERKRLFDLPRSSWEDYNSKLISKGGGVFKRSAKSILLTPEIKTLFNIEEDTLEPNQLIQAMLKANVDLLWNGGIGTYVKAESETNDQVGDRANDALRINGSELNCRVVGEGGNLGFTQLGRVEGARKGIRIYTDFIDNAAGVDCSDHEVNIKILLNTIVQNGDMTAKQRNELLMSMTDEVADLVLHNNYRQTQAVSIANKRSLVRLEDHIRLIHDLERLGKLDRALEGLPTDEELKERKMDSCGLSAPELSVLIAYTKNILQEELLESDLPDDPHYETALQSAFPIVLREKHGDIMRQHRLKREIISTQIANNMINKMGASFVLRLKGETGATAAAILKSYSISRSILGMSELWKDIESLDNQVPAELQLTMMLELMRLARRSTRWFLRNYRKDLDITKLIKYFAPRVNELSKTLSTALSGKSKEQVDKAAKNLIDSGVPEKLAYRIAGLRTLFPAMDIIQGAKEADQSVKEMAEFYFSLGEKLNLQWFRDQISQHTPANHWESLAVAAFRDDFDYHQSALAIEVSRSTPGGETTAERVAAWVTEHKSFVTQWNHLVSESSTTGPQELAMFAVAIRELSDLVQLSRSQDVKPRGGRDTAGLVAVK